MIFKVLSKIFQDKNKLDSVKAERKIDMVKNKDNGFGDINLKSVGVLFIYLFFIFLLVVALPNSRLSPTLYNIQLLLIYGIFFFLIFKGIKGFLVWTFSTKISELGRRKITSLKNMSSYPNNTNQSAGYSFSAINEIKFFSKKKDSVYINNFAYYDESKAYANNNILEESKRLEVKIDKLDFTKTFLVLGSMGSGKTEFFHSVINQKVFERKILHDVKGDFVQKWFNPKTDYIFNPYDARGFYWDIWEEMKSYESLVESFINNILQSQTEEKDFFTSSAKKVVLDAFLRTHHMNQNKTSSEKWFILNSILKEYEELGSKDKTKASIFATMELILDIFSYFEYQSTQKDIKYFTISKFLDSKGTLFLLNNPAVSKKLTPLFAGFTSMITDIMLSREDTKENLTLILLDEYLSLNFEKDTRLKILTQIRSKGGCLILGMQYLPKKDKEHQQLLDSSCYGTLIFKINDNETVKHIIDSLGDIEYLLESSGKDNKKELKTRKFLQTEHLQSMPSYHHLALFLSEKIIYLGYTKLIELPTKNENFKAVDQKDYYKFKYRTSIFEDDKVIKKLNDLSTFSDDEKEELISSFMALENDKKAEKNFFTKHNIEEGTIIQFMEERLK
jgi:hypothetical protein